MISSGWKKEIWDIFPKDFTKNGAFENLIQFFKKANFKDLLHNEINHVHLFLKEWEKQLKNENHSNKYRKLLDELNLIQLFNATPELSGVLYISQNHVLSESLFIEHSPNVQHLTDRIIHDEVKQYLPSWTDLTFSFPRQYKFDGFYNSWGFIRVERSNNEINGKAVVLSATTIDPQIMFLMKTYGFENLISLYNKTWDYAIHDYIHHIALYTNPSFGIGKLSPMSLADVNLPIENWGTAMRDTFNYEYWAHRTHRLITKKIISEHDKKQIIFNGVLYFNEVYNFLQVLLQHYNPGFVQKVSNYLIQIYLWPIHVLIHPLDPLFEEFNSVISFLKVDVHLSPHEEIKKMLDLLEKNKNFSESDSTFMALNELIKGLRIKEKLNGFSNQITWFDVMRLSVDITVQRGVYEGWFHDNEIFFQNQPMSEHLIMLNMIQSLNETFSSFAKKKYLLQTYTLKGIVP